MGLSEFPNFDEVMRARLVAATDRLAEEFAGVYDRVAISSLVEESARDLSADGVTPFVHILAERFARERLRAQAQTSGEIAKAGPEVLFVSLTGGGRAQIGAALLALQAGDAVSVHSAGSDAVTEIDANVDAALKEHGVDLAEAFTKPLTPEVLASADLVITLGRSVGAVEIPETVRRLDWRVGDPAGADLEEVRRVIDDIERRITAFARDTLPELTAELAAQR